MGLTTNIEWADVTYNVWRGCSKVSEGCRFCYAEKVAKQNPQVLGSWGSGPRVAATGDYWSLPARAAARAAAERRRLRVFVNSLADFWEDTDVPLLDVRGDTVHVSAFNRLVAKSTHDISLLRPATLDDVRATLLGQVAEYPGLDWLILTKRPTNIRPLLKRLADDPAESPVSEAARVMARAWLDGDAPRNVWLGVSVENDKTRHRIMELADVPAACRFVSAEPLIGPVDFSPFLRPNVERDRGFGFFAHDPHCSWTAGSGCSNNAEGLRLCVPDGDPGVSDFFNWVILGGESGSRLAARACDLRWIDDSLSQLTECGVPVFVKQLGTNPYRDGKRLALTHPKGEDPAEWPEFLRVQEYPVVDGTEQPWDAPPTRPTIST